MLVHVHEEPLLSRIREKVAHTHTQASKPGECTLLLICVCFQALKVEPTKERNEVLKPLQDLSHACVSETCISVDPGPLSLLKLHQKP